MASRERSDTEQGAVLRGWFSERFMPAFADRILPFDLAAVRVLATNPGPERAPLDDALVAGLAQANKPVVATRNTSHFETLRVRLLKPLAL